MVRFSLKDSPSDRTMLTTPLTRSVGASSKNILILLSLVFITEDVERITRIYRAFPTRMTSSAVNNRTIIVFSCIKRNYIFNVVVVFFSSDKKKITKLTINKRTNVSFRITSPLSINEVFSLEKLHLITAGGLEEIAPQTRRALLPE